MRTKSRAIFLGYINMIIHNLTSFILTPIMLMVWGNSDFGIYKILLGFMAYFMLVDAGIKNSIIKFMTGFRVNNEKKQESNYFAFILLFYLIVIVILLLISIGFRSALYNIYHNSLTIDEISTVYKAFPYIVLYAGVVLFFNGFSAIIRAYNRHGFVQLLNIIKSVIRVLSIFLALNNGAEIFVIIIFDLIISMFFSIMMLLYITFNLKVIPRFRGLSFDFAKTIFNYTGIMFIQTIAFALFWSLDNLILGILTSAAIVAIYSIGATITNLFQVYSSVLSQVLVPDIMTKGYKEDQDTLDNLMLRIGKLKFYWLLLPALGFIYFGKTFLMLWVGTDFIQAYYVVIIVLIPQLFSLIIDVPTNVMYVRHKHKPMAYFSLFAAIINSIITVVLVLKYGILGAAVGTAFALFVVYVVFANIYYRRNLGFKIGLLYKEVLLNNILFLIIINLIGLMLSYVEVSTWIYLIIVISVFIVSYIGAVFLFVLNKIEKETVFLKIKIFLKIK
ncbi:MAG: oligosaccharide flippase family protein [Vulcanibacillus sp.]